MATTKIWSVKDDIKRVILYASNPEKTKNASIAKVLHYAENSKKTTNFDGEKAYLVSSVNCKGDPYKSMMAVRRQFGDRGTIRAFHAYQSFKPGEVTPDECHKIGVELARKLWGKEYQVLVATHVNCPHLHNHFVINPISFRTGKKMDSGLSNYYNLRSMSDEICRQHGLSVIQTDNTRTPRNIYFAEKAGENTRYNLMRQAIDNSLVISPSWDDFIAHLHDEGYEFDRNEGRKYAKMKPINGTKWTRIYHLGEDYTLDAIDQYLREAREGLHGNHFDHDEGYRYIRWENRYKPLPQYHWYHRLERGYSPLLALVLTFVYIIGGPDLITPDRPLPTYTPLTPEAKLEMRKAERLMRQVRLLADNHIHTKEEADAFLDTAERDITDWEMARQEIYNKIRRCKDENEQETLKKKARDISKILKPLRQKVSDMQGILQNSGVMADIIEKEETARREKLLREYSPMRSEREELRKTLPDYEEQEKREYRYER